MRNIRKLCMQVLKSLKKYFSSLLSHISFYSSSQKGFTLVEFLLVMSIFVVMTGIATVNLFSFQRESQLNATFNTFVADIKNQQTKAMSGDTAGEGVVQNYGIIFDAANFRYILFGGTYSATNSANFAVTIPNTIQISTTLPNSQLIFSRGSGEVSGYSSTSASITLRDTATNDQRIIQLNRYGVITSVTN